MLVRVAAPVPVVSYAEAKKHLRLDHDDDQDYVEALVATATAWIDGSEGWLGRALGPQTYDLKLDGAWWAWPCDDRRARWWDGRAHPLGGLVLPLPPLLAVVSISYRDPDGALQTFPAASYQVSGIGAPNGGRIVPASGATWPAVAPGPEALTVRFRAGYEAGEPPAPAVPAPIKHAILLMVGHLYANREQVTTGQKPEVLPLGVEALLAPFRVWAL